MSESNAGSWPEQDAMEKWWEKHRHELKLKTEATKYRISLQSKLTEAQARIEELGNELKFLGATFMENGDLHLDMKKYHAGYKTALGNELSRYKTAFEKLNREWILSKFAMVEQAKDSPDNIDSVVDHILSELKKDLET